MITAKAIDEMRMENLAKLLSKLDEIEMTQLAWQNERFIKETFLETLQELIREVDYLRRTKEEKPE